ncbi:MAG: DNA alkylation repair protein [Nitratireductor sp.]|nr:DNA alkylation repair protein [Nitratireductor sp.]
MAKPLLSSETLLGELKSRADPRYREGMARYGIPIERALGVSMPETRAVARLTRRSQETAEGLWQSGFHEARILAGFVAEPARTDRGTADRWVADFDAWDLCDQVCGSLFCRAEWAPGAVCDWAGDEREFVRRAAFAILAWQAVHLKEAPDETFLGYLPLIENAAGDGRNYVKKAVSWALRQIGKRSAALHGPALELARKLSATDSRAAAWIGRDAARELDSAAVRDRLGLT